MSNYFDQLPYWAPVSGNFFRWCPVYSAYHTRQYVVINVSLMLLYIGLAYNL